MTTPNSELLCDLASLQRLFAEREAEYREMNRRVDNLDLMFRTYARDVAMEILLAVSEIDSGDTEAARDRLLVKVEAMQTLTGPVIATRVQ